MEREETMSVIVTLQRHCVEISLLFERTESQTNLSKSPSMHTQVQFRKSVF
jgi:hypothetical protein